MPTYRVAHHDERPDLVVEAERLCEEADQLVLRTTLLVAGRPRDIVVLRVRQCDVASVVDGDLECWP